LAWLSQQGYGSSGQTSKGSEHESDKENHLTSHKASPITTSLPQVSMDIASRLQNAFWAANLNRDNPYGSWMNSGVNSGFAAVAAAAAAAMNSSATIGTPAATSSRYLLEIKIVDRGKVRSSQGYHRSFIIAASKISSKISPHYFLRSEKTRIDLINFCSKTAVEVSLRTVCCCQKLRWYFRKGCHGISGGSAMILPFPSRHPMPAVSNTRPA
jgi:hypothetical protein